MIFGENPPIKCPYGSMKLICGQYGPKTILINFENICFQGAEDVSAPLSSQSDLVFKNFNLQNICI